MRMRELCATALVQVGLWILDLATAIDEPRELSPSTKREAPEPEPDEAPKQAPITAEAAELLAPPPVRKHAPKAIDEALRGSVRARREKAAAL